MLKVKILEHTPNPENLIGNAGRLCYSKLGIDDLFEKYTDEDNSKMVAKLAAMGHCYDEKTEVLTSEGFKNWKDVNYDTEIATIDPSTRNIVGFENPLALQKYEVDEELIKVSARDVDLNITHGHKIYCSLSRSVDERANPRNFKLVATNEIISDQSGKMEVYRKPMRMIKSAKNPNKTITNTDKLYMLYGFFIGDGYCTNGNQLKFHLKLNRKIKFLKELCEELNLCLEEQANNSYVIISENIGTEYRKKFYNRYNEKNISKFILYNIQLTV